ncbi:MAG TPA: ATP-binding protein [Actinomycetota bacterium]|nr:ATP-binding protein [Actinomycetota bacterium]
MALRGGQEAPGPSAEVVRPLADLEHAVRSSSIARAVESALEPDRAVLAYAVHDGLTQVVTASVLELESLARRVEVEPSEVVSALHEAVVELRLALDEIREMLATLTPPAPVESLEQTLGRAIERWQLPATWSVEGDLTSVPATVLEVASAVIREAVANAAKHAQTDRVSVRVQAWGDELEVDVEDHGKGFEDGPAIAGHLGLGMLRRRVAEAHGTLDIGPAPGGGTLVVAHLPIADPGGSS